MRLACLVTASLLLLVSFTTAQQQTLPLWPNGTPEPTRITGPEHDATTPTDAKVAGRVLLHLTDVAKPTLAVYPTSSSSNPSPAILVFPGGGYKILAYDLEGTEVCTWLNSVGVTCILVKYRVPFDAHFPASTEDLEDAQQAMRLTRANAAAWHIDPKRIGVLGFSAGAHLAAVLSNHADFISPNVPASTIDAKPAFAFIIYPGYLATPPALDKLDPDINPTAATPPTFLLQAENDPVHVENVLVYFKALKDLKVPAELHIFAEGGHGYGLRPTDLPITHWPDLATTWLHTIHILGPKTE